MFEAKKYTKMTKEFVLLLAAIFPLLYSEYVFTCIPCTFALLIDLMMI